MCSMINIELLCAITWDNDFMAGYCDVFVQVGLCALCIINVSTYVS